MAPMRTSPGVAREVLRLRVGGTGLHAVRLRVARPSAPIALVFLHEGLGSVAQWQDFPDALCAELGLAGLVYDRARHGGSDAPPAARTVRYLHDEAWQVLPAVLDAARVERAVLVGHSDGGTIALLFAARFPDQVAATITEAAHVFVEPETLAGIEAAVAAWRTTDLRHRLARHHGEKAEALFHAWADTWLAPGFRDWNVEADIAGLACPLLLIQGAEDEYGTAGQLDAIAGAARGPVERLLLPGIGHTPHRQARAATLQAMTAFVRSRVPEIASA
jgi:pimeloyl-ACP methyl ester carboxylesterase